MRLFIHAIKNELFILASHQTGFDTSYFFIIGILEKGDSQARAETLALLDCADHRLTGWNVNQVTPLNMDSLIAWTRLEVLVLF